MNAGAVPVQRFKAAKPGFVEKTLAGITSGIEQAVFSEENARRDGWLQRRDPRAKILAFILLVTAVAVSRDWQVLGALYVLTLLLAAVSKIDLLPYVKSVWLGMGLFSAIVVFPSIFLVGHNDLFSLPLGMLTLHVHTDGLAAAGIFVLRVAASVSLAILLILTTRWADILKSLRVLHVPTVFILVLSMTYRYVFLLLHTATGMFLARKSRMVASTSGKEQRWWIVAAIGVLMNRSFRMSEDVYMAMVARGFNNEVRGMTDYRMQAFDWLMLAGAAAASVLAVYAGKSWF
ncbi:MAG TPA: cobalt ECF transporter T component CbiQ [Dehalococcoidia bacterium]|nr:cobalt ECF transporter T component CbiQ [Dehalococcoidia bacterium]